MGVTLVTAVGFVAYLAYKATQTLSDISLPSLPEIPVVSDETKQELNSDLAAGMKRAGGTAAQIQSAVDEQNRFLANTYPAQSVTQELGYGLSNASDLLSWDKVSYALGMN